MTPSRNIATHLVALFACACALVCAGPAVASSGPFGPSLPARGYVPDQLIVKFRAGTSSSTASAALAATHGRVLRALPIRGVRLVQLPAGSDVPEAARELRRDPGIAWAEPNSYGQGGSLPDDPMFGQQWALQNTGQTVHGEAGTPGDDIRAATAWSRTTGSPGVLVGVVDSGVNLDSPDLAPNIVSGGWDFVQNDAEPEDAFGHGTVVAGIVGARGNDGVGVTGVDWNASILPVRVLNNLNTGSCANIAAGTAYAASAGARVVNLSIYSHSRCEALEEAIAAAPGTLFVTIAGNDGLDTAGSPTYPCEDPEPNVICVAASDQHDQLASFSNYGPGVDLAAPGTNIESTFLRWGPTETFDQDGFETPLNGRWTTTGAWDRTIQNPLDGVFALTDSPFADYPNDSYTYAQRVLDLSGRNDCAVKVAADAELGSGDMLAGEVIAGGGAVEEGGLAGVSDGYEKEYFDLAPIEGRSDGIFRFALQSDETGVGDGVYLDDFSVLCVPVLRSYSGAPDEYEIDYGTSMAAPYVSGTAALILSLNPALSAVQVKERILATADPVPALAGVVESAGRLDAGRAVETIPAPAPPAVAGPSGGASGPRTASPRGSAGSVLGASISALRSALSRPGARRLLRRGGALRVTLRAPAAGRFTATLLGIATGSRTARRAGRVRLTLLASRRGRAALAARRALEVVLILRFTPRGGAVASRSITFRLR